MWGAIGRRGKDKGVGEEGKGTILPLCPEAPNVLWAKGFQHVPVSQEQSGSEPHREILSIAGLPTWLRKTCHSETNSAFSGGVRKFCNFNLVYPKMLHGSNPCRRCTRAAGHHRSLPERKASQRLH